MSTPSKLRGLPALFRVSKWIFNEAIDSVLGDTSEIRISDSEIITNFPLETLLTPRSPDRVADGDMIIAEHRIQLPPCQTIEVTIQLPPRAREGLILTRRNVAKVVDWLNTCDRQVLLNIKARLDFTLNGGGVNGVWNDFAILMGPLSKLRKRCTSAAVSRDTGYSYNARIEEQCARLEAVLNGERGPARKAIVYQQSILDIRLPVKELKLYYERNEWLEEESRVFHPFQKTDPRGEEGSRLIATLEGIFRLNAWCRTHGEDPPPWLDALFSVVKRVYVIRAEAKAIFDRVLSPGGVRQYDYWISGISTAFDPFKF